MSQQKTFPAIPEALLKELEARFPDRMPDTTTSLDDIYRKQGQVSVIRFLRDQFTRQNTTVIVRS